MKFGLYWFLGGFLVFSCSIIVLARESGQSEWSTVAILMSGLVAVTALVVNISVSYSRENFVFARTTLNEAFEVFEKGMRTEDKYDRFFLVLSAARMLAIAQRIGKTKLLPNHRDSYLNWEFHTRVLFRGLWEKHAGDSLWAALSDFAEKGNQFPDKSFLDAIAMIVDFVRYSYSDEIFQRSLLLMSGATPFLLLEPPFGDTNFSKELEIAQKIFHEKLKRVGISEIN